ncbi:MAG: SymE family type I addiction module toxin [Bacteroidetes bacterium]|nr:SymE family type I addiction module toxin [Bacteroidota bacterium]
MTTKTTISRRVEKRGGNLIKPSYVEVPTIYFGGKYLKKAGFEIGEKLNVEVTEGEIILKRPTPALLRMVEKNPNILLMIDTLHLKQIA